MIAIALHDYGGILRVTTTQRTPRLLKALAWLTAVLWAAMAAAGMAGLLPDMAPTPAALLRQLVCAAALALLVVWSTVFMPGSVLIHSAASARMLPRQRRRLFQLAYGSWALLCAVLAFSMDKWSLFLAAGTLSLALGLLFAGRSAGAWLLVSGLAATVLLPFLPPSVCAALGTATGLLALGALLLALGWIALRTHYPPDGSERMRQRTATDPLGNTVDPHGGGRLWAGTAVVLRRAIRSRNPQGLLAHGMGPAFHWATAAQVPASMLGLVLAAWSIMAWHGVVLSKDAAGGMTAGLAGTATWSIGVQSLMLRKQLAARRGEQALLRLAPLVGDAAMLNRRLAGAMLKSALLCWFLVTAMCLSMLAAGGATPRQLEIILAMCCAGGQFGLSQLPDDFARRPMPAVGACLGTLWIILIEAILTLGMGAYAGLSGWPWFAALSVGVGAVQVRSGWRRLLAAPPALPVGRMEEKR